MTAKYDATTTTTAELPAMKPQPLGPRGAELWRNVAGQFDEAEEVDERSVRRERMEERRAAAPFSFWAHVSRLKLKEKGICLGLKRRGLLW